MKDRVRKSENDAGADTKLFYPWGKVTLALIFSPCKGMDNVKLLYICTAACMGLWLECVS